MHGLHNRPGPDKVAKTTDTGLEQDAEPIDFLSPYSGAQFVTSRRASVSQVWPVGRRTEPEAL